ncbi:hypothetical protein F5148DRAFT_1191549 [Russula earlei]|uniref:Uncharacterized protein n=1 Tax=Russula earlei TaxID=71964 RepID=A0ACC0UDM0_9AGAM|nr:hypothetical protein F5148DRAFT_1191549 [Russula earlei]
MTVSPFAPPSANQVQGAQFVNDYINHPDYRLVAAFCLGSVFFSGLRHVWFSAFLRQLMWSCKEIVDRMRARTVETGASERFPHEKSGEMRRAAFEQRDTLVLLLCMGFMLASLSSFLSLLTFDLIGSGAACAFPLVPSASAILGLDLRHRLRRRPWESGLFWAWLGLGIVFGGITAGIGTGQLVSPVYLYSVALCFRKRFLPTSLVSSILNLMLEFYVIIRSLSLTPPSQLNLLVVKDARIIQAGSLFLFDLLIVVPNATTTSWVAEFVPYAIGALGVLAAFNSSFGQSSLNPARSGDPGLTSRGLHDAPGHPFYRGDASNRVLRIQHPHVSTLSDPNMDIEAHISPFLAPQTTQRAPPSGRVYADAIPIASPQPVKAYSPTSVYEIVSPVAQLKPVQRVPREKILSYSSPIWETFGASHSEAPPCTEVVDNESPASSIRHSIGREAKDQSTRSTVLGSDIIRTTSASSNEWKNRMRIRRSAIGRSHSLATSNPSSSSRRVTGQSSQSRESTDPSPGEDISPATLPPKAAVHWQLSRPSSSKSKSGSKSSRSSKSRKSSGSMRSAKGASATSAEGSSSMSPWVENSIVRRSKTFSATSRGNRVSFVRGPRPPPSSTRLRDSALYGP